MLLVTEKICKDNNGIRIVSNVDLQVESGECVAIIGANGAGKTTFFDLITGITPVTTGRIFYNNHDITELKAHDRNIRGITRIFENIRLFDNLTARDNIIIGRYCRASSGLMDGFLYSQRICQEQRLNESKVSELLELVGLSSCRDRLAESLTYGAQRRLEIARALAGDPQLLLLDEPAAGMNHQELDEFLQVLDEVKRQGVTILLIAQQMRLVMGIANRVIVFERGKKTADILPQEMYVLGKLKDLG